ncbi:hypothetical protein RFI_18537 [Reticulomyxa filosa]|uniref:Uncharacterized protein n=1 Tax=Reticulomyxa filosa TaxID=46433 RepID=X6MXZ4_RETFI|nr:hypothetical protein RFI_18537 [Reticulomyxa filosa]|eukprot:ETO18716.1 hypothetical protein RFI_18537 [Reticulomyxa filosa]
MTQVAESEVKEEASPFTGQFELETTENFDEFMEKGEQMGWVMRKLASVSGETIRAYHDPATNAWKAHATSLAGEMVFSTVLDPNKEFFFTTYTGEQTKSKAYFKPDTSNKVVLEEHTRFELKPPKFHIIEKFFEDEKLILKFTANNVSMKRKFKRISKEPGFSPKILQKFQEIEKAAEKKPLEGDSKETS